MADRQVTPADEVVLRTMLSLAMGSFVGAVAYAIQAAALGTPPQPWLGVVGTVLATASVIYRFVAVRAARTAQRTARRESWGG